MLLLASIHFLLLTEPGLPLAEWYPNLSPDPRRAGDVELSDMLTRFVHDRSPQILELLGTRRVQTNEVGRCSLFLPAFGRIADEVGRLAHIDVGTSAGLTTLIPHFAYRYDDGPVIGSGTPLLECSTRGRGNVPMSVPDIVTSRGIDVAPLDVTDPDDARWLQACCWPDQSDRFERLSEAIAVARVHPPEIVVGDAVDMIGATVESAGSNGHPVVTTSWVMNYLTPTERRRFVARLDVIGADRDLSWVVAESPALTPELPHPPGSTTEQTTALTVITWRDGRRSAEHLATCHPHGYWLHWR